MALSPAVLAAERARRARSFAGIITLLAGIAFIVDAVWLIMASSFFLIQLPILMGCLYLVMFFGLGYVLNPPAWTGAALMAIVYFGQDFTLRQGLVSDGGMDLQTVVKGMLAVLLFAYGLFNGLSRTWRHPVLMVWFAYAAFAAMSASYSSAKAIGIGSGIALLAISFGSARAATVGDRDFYAYWRGLYTAACVMCVISLILLVALPMMARDLADPGAFRLRGLTGSANSIGPILTVGLIIGLSMQHLARDSAWRWWHRFMMLCLLVGLVLTNSRSSMLGLAAGVAAEAVIARRHTVLTALVAMLGAAVGAVVILVPSVLKGFVTVFTELFSRSGQAQEITSFTGRSDVWKACLKLIQEQPWFGYGLGSVRVEIPKVFWDAWGNTTATAHNFVLESMISVGLLGTSLLVIVLVMTTLGLVRYVSAVQSPFADETQREWTRCALRCMLMFWVHSMVERAFAGTAAPSTVVLGVCVATYAFMALKLKDERHQRMIRLRSLV
ncbi:O-antigen ligase family protein [Aquabacterium sp.]|uniref:O-antigen ligase family protein n=1 Tax=Aquabacterium sp. TaxID=1872578 RepID=UPI0035B4059C